MERSKSLSVKSIKHYKIVLVTSLSVMVLVYIGFYAIHEGVFGKLLAFFYLGMLTFYWYPSIGKFLRQIKELTYDDQNLYVKEADYEIQIPFYQVKDIELVSLDGLYKFKLYHHDQFGKEVICKPSLWYPLNYKRIDAELNRIRSLVRKAHQNYKDEIINGNALASYN